jgi:hypothetical protein
MIGCNFFVGKFLIRGHLSCKQRLHNPIDLFKTISSQNQQGVPIHGEPIECSNLHL